MSMIPGELTSDMQLWNAFVAGYEYSYEYGQKVFNSDTVEVDYDPMHIQKAFQQFKTNIT